MDYGIEKIRKGDMKAFAALYDRLGETALRTATAIVGHDGLAGDVVQETFLRVYRNIHRFDVKKPFEPWFYRILINESRRVLRWKRRLVPVETMPEACVCDEIRDMDLYKAIVNLDLSLRVPLVLRYLAGYKDREVADILNIRLSTEKGRVKRAKYQLRKYLEQGETK